MSGMKTAYDAPEAAANRKLCEETNGQIRLKGKNQWMTKYRIWADPSRAENPDGSISESGENITDIDCFLRTKDGRLVPCFVVGGDNLHDPSVLVDIDTLNVVVDDIEGGNARMKEPDGTKITAAHVLKNLGKYFKHMGLDESVNMLGNFKVCTLRFQVHIVELEVGQTLDDLEEGQLVMTAQNYHSRENQARNLNILFSAQGASITTDASAPGIPVCLYLQGKSQDDGKLHNYAIGVEATKRVFSQTGKQSMEEKQEQVARGRSAEVKLGPDHPDMIEMCAIMHGQIPCKRKNMKPGFISPGSLVAAAMAEVSDDLIPQKYNSLCAMPPPPVTTSVAVGIPVVPPPDWEMVDEAEEEEEEPHYCSATAAPPIDVGDDDDDDVPSDEPVMRCGGPTPTDEGALYRGGNPGKTRSLSAPVMRSLSGASPVRKMARAAPPPPPEEECRAASTHRGVDIGVCEGINQTDLEPDDGGPAGIPTFTFSIFMVKPKGKKFGTKDVENAINLAEKVRKCAGEAHVRNHYKMKEAGATSAGISQQSAVEIAETIKAIHHRAKITNIPVC